MDNKSLHKRAWNESLITTRHQYDNRADKMRFILTILFVLLIIIILAAAGWWNEYNQIPAFIWALFGLDILAMLANAFFVPLMAYLNMWHVANDIYEHQQDELSKFNWDKVEFEETPYSVIGKSGYALRLINNKNFDISKIQIILTEVNINGKSRPKPKKAWYFQSIDYDNEIFTFLDDNGIKSGDFKDYAVTEIIKKRKSPVCKLTTSSDIEDDYIKLPYQGLKRDSNSEVVIEVALRGGIRIDNDKIPLPERYMKISILPNGEIKIRRKGDIQK